CIVSGFPLRDWMSTAIPSAPPLVALTAVIGNPLEALTAVFLLQRLGGFDPRLQRIRDVFALVLAGAVACVAGATVGTAGLVQAGVVPWSDALTTWTTWWGGDVLGIVVVTAVLLAWFTRPWPRLSPWGDAEA